MTNSAYQPIAEFYSGKSILITGGTGFLGKVIVEKLLYTCKKLDKIYLLIREKQNVDVETRLQNIFNDPVFSRLKEISSHSFNKVVPICGDITKPSLGISSEDERVLLEKVFSRLKEISSHSFNKVVPICGDITKPSLGISSEDERVLLEKVSIIIHSAATVKFNQRLKLAWADNVEATRMILTLAQRMKRLEVFLHVSTAYTNTDREVHEEILYPAPDKLDEADHIRDFSEEETSRIIDGRPNTYTFTKAVAEHLVAENIANMPTIIVRPSLVGPIARDPVKGWTDWSVGPASILFVAQGLQRVVFGQKSNIADIIPVDYVSNLIIAACAKNHRQRELKIYNCCTGDCNPLRLGKFFKDSVENLNKNEEPSIFYIHTSRHWVLSIVTVLFEMIPAYVADMYRQIKGKPPKYVELHSRSNKTREGVKYFTNHSWIMKTDNTRKLFSILSDSDKKLFPFNPTAINWNEYLSNYAEGIRQLLKRNSSTK